MCIRDRIISCCCWIISLSSASNSGFDITSVTITEVISNPEFDALDKEIIQQQQEIIKTQLAKLNKLEIDVYNLNTDLLQFQGAGNLAQIRRDLRKAQKQKRTYEVAFNQLEGQYSSMRNVLKNVIKRFAPTSLDKVKKKFPKYPVFDDDDDELI